MGCQAGSVKASQTPYAPRIVRGAVNLVQGTDRDDEHLNIFLEFVPGGSIASLLTKFGEPLR